MRGSWLRDAERGLAAVARSRRLRRIEAAWAASVTGDAAIAVTLAVTALRAGGVNGVGLMILCRSVPAAVLGPLLAGLADRRRRERVIAAVLLVRATIAAVLLVAVHAGGGIGVLAALAGAEALAYSLYWPAQSALLPALAETPEELTATNVASTTIENVGMLVGPLLAGAGLSAAGPGWVFGVVAAVFGGGAALMVRIDPLPRPARSRERRAEAMVSGFRTLFRHRDPRLVICLYLAQAASLGALGVLIVVIAVRIAGVGEPGVGYLNGAVGFGGLAGSLATIALVGRRRMGRKFGSALVVWGAALAAIAAAPGRWTAVALLVVVGAGAAVVDVTSLTLLQRIVSDRLLARLLGALEGLWWGAMGVGAAVAAPLVDHAGIRATLVALGAAIVVLAIATARAVDGVDDRARVPERELALLGGVPLFAPLSPLALQRLALELSAVEFDAGATIITRGEPGDRFYVVDCGEVTVSEIDIDIDTDFGARIGGPGSSADSTLGAGSWFGEIALLLDVPRTATVTAVTDVRAFALQRDEFLSAVTARGTRGD